MQEHDKANNYRRLSLQHLPQNHLFIVRSHHPPALCYHRDPAQRRRVYDQLLLCWDVAFVGRTTDLAAVLPGEQVQTDQRDTRTLWFIKDIRLQCAA